MFVQARRVTLAHLFLSSSLLLQIPGRRPAEPLSLLETSTQPPLSCLLSQCIIFPKRLQGRRLSKENDVRPLSLLLTSSSSSIRYLEVGHEEASRAPSFQGSKPWLVRAFVVGRKEKLSFAREGCCKHRATRSNGFFWEDHRRVQCPRSFSPRRNLFLSVERLDLSGNRGGKKKE